jgi:hypothetical protein
MHSRRWFGLLALIGTATVTYLSYVAVAIHTWTPPGNHYYVSQTGSDNNDGLSPETAWATLQHAADNLILGITGTIVHVAPGTYDSATYCSVSGLVNGRTMVCMLKSGAPSQPIIFQSDQKWEAKLTCPLANSFFVLIGSYIQVVGFDMSCPGGTFAAGTYGDNGHNQFLGNYLHDFDTDACDSVGILFGGNGGDGRGSANLGHDVASGNVIHHGGAEAGAPNHCNQYHGIYFGDPYDIITNNVISGLIGWAIHSYGSGVCHQVISNNTIFNNSQGGILIENVGSTRGYWDECRNGSIADYMTVNDNISVNNGIGRTYTGTTAGIDATGYGTGGKHNLYSNNLVFGNEPRNATLAAPDISIQQKTGTISSLFANFQPDTNWAPASPYNYLNYSLAPGSPAIGAGTTDCAPGVNSCAPTIDVTGARRPQRVYDIGAFAFFQSALLPLHLTPAKRQVLYTSEAWPTFADRTRPDNVFFNNVNVMAAKSR